MFLGKNKVSTSRRQSNAIENGYINSKPPHLLNLDETKRTNPPITDSIQSQHHYGKTLNVPDLNNVLHVLPMVTPPAPLNPPRPAIMTTPKSSIISVKNPSTSIALSPTETRPLLLVTTDNCQQQPQTMIVPNGRRLPLNGQMTSRITSSKQASAPLNIDHQTIRETTTEKIPTKKFINNRPRTALFFSSTRVPDQSPEQHQPLLGSSGNDTSSRHDSLDSHTSTDDGFGLNENWPMRTRAILSSNRTVPTKTSSPLINTAQPRPQGNTNSRQLPSLPMPIRQLPLVPNPSRQLPIIDNANSTKLYFDINDSENEDESLSTRFAHPGELFYYQTSSASSSSSSSSSSSDSNSSSSENSDNENNQEQFQIHNQEQEQEAEDEDENDDAILPCEYEA
ncbi:unnamed protein product [Rotaria sp. Silwood2]|nr:unnamed protein product [Rotaria sp. Silwood2]CAF2606488.1 unnamed protein product [Rotaria sp. Silwood2]CAF2848256.1 unnamed protein product [Rotaria sp. Silwood2]CAF3020671.1 unnamed protein product [Rotaria sp. Silwood2]CAF4204527.1 unnamed protein product [Rotaria sp. Silwood2]